MSFAGLITRADLLTALLPQWQLLLQTWSASGRLSAAARQALVLQGDSPALSALVTQWSDGIFSALPPIELLPTADMNGALGAYAISTGTIYLNADWLAAASQERVLAVLTEELGHHLDALLNPADSRGDEGELFASLLLAPAGLSGAQQEVLRQQDDHANLPLAVELADSPPLIRC